METTTTHSKEQTTEQQAAPGATVTIKASLNNELRRFRLPRDANFNTLSEELVKAFGVSPSDKLNIKYKDEEEDLITMSSDNELQEAIEISSSGVLRLELEKISLPQFQPQPTPQPQQPQVPVQRAAVQPQPTQFAGYPHVDKRTTPVMPNVAYYAPPQHPQYYAPPQQFYPTAFNLPIRSNQGLNLQRQQIDQMKAGRKQHQQQAEQRKKWRQEKSNAAAAAVAASAPMPEPSRKVGVKHMARFVKDVTVDDGTEFVPNTRFVKIWKFRNESNIAWPPGSELVFVGKRSDRMGSPDAVPVNVVAMPGEEVDVSICLQSPTKSGRYIGYWRLRGPDGRKFGQRVWCSIRVPSYSSSSSSSSSSDDSSNDPPHEFLERMEALGYSKKRSKKVWKKYSDTERQQFVHPPSPMQHHLPILTSSSLSPPVTQQPITQAESPGSGSGISLSSSK
eukprot:TRINITY_DN1644_c0_g1_i1.p1 TRINITY_DN1644_c0_g1~~TRINITY_DN1644_c0_g1_i1.p1  ORF type:complete len:449 (+),score=123.33 TRINITY_DN1644_c0_g1_i1:517-1863(+)